MATKNKTIYASAILQDASKWDASSPKTKSFEKTKSTSTTVLIQENAVNTLKKFGFKINVISDQIISIDGTKKLFEKIFNTVVTEYQKENTTYYKADSIIIPAELQPFIKGIVFSEPMELF
jgi:subtilase family serine protease